jgi:hypothetical protein
MQARFFRFSGADFSLAARPSLADPASLGRRGLLRLSGSSRTAVLPPTARNPNITVAAMVPMAGFPSFPGNGSRGPFARNPHPMPIPAPITCHPNIARSWGRWRFFCAEGGRRFRHNNCFRRPWLSYDYRFAGFRLRHNHGFSVFWLFHGRCFFDINRAVPAATQESNGCHHR